MIQITLKVETLKYFLRGVLSVLFLYSPVSIASNILWEHEETKFYTAYVKSEMNPHKVHIGASVEIIPKETEIRSGFYLQKKESIKNKKVIALIPGRAGHIAETWVKETTHELVTRGYVVFAMDPIGQGLSEGNSSLCSKFHEEKCCSRKGHIEDFDHYLLGMLDFLKSIRQGTGKKITLLPHSMSGALYLKLRLNYPLIDEWCVQKAYPIAPMISFNTGKFPCLVAFGACYLATLLGYGDSYVLGRGPEKEAIGSSYQHHYVGGPTFKWTYLGFMFTRELWKKSKAQHFKRNIKIINCGQDKIVVPKQTEKFAEKNSISIQMMKDSGHNPLSLPGSRGVVLDMVDKEAREENEGPHWSLYKKYLQLIKPPSIVLLCLYYHLRKSI